MPGTHAPADQRFWRHVSKTAYGCWEWTGSINESGYGQFKVNGRPVKASRFSWQLHFGPIADGLLVCHYCDNPPCVRPDHLFLGTPLDNNQDMMHKGRGAATRPAEVQKLVAVVRRLSDRDIASVRLRHNAGESCRAIARSLGCHHTTIVRLVNGVHWRQSAEAAA